MTRLLYPLAVLSLLACGSRPPLPEPSSPLTPTPTGALPARPPDNDADESAPLPVAREYQLDTGLTVRHVYREGWPLIGIYLVNSKAGEVYPADQAGISRLGNWSLARFASGKVGGVSINSSTGYEGADLHANVRPREVAATLAALGEALADPTPPDATIEDVRIAQLNDMRDYQRSSLGSALVVAREYLFGRGHHLSVSPHGSVAAVADTSPDDVRASIAARWNPSNCALVVVGDIDQATLDPLIASSLAGFAEHEGVDPAIQQSGERPERSVFTFHDGSEAASVILVDRAPLAGADDVLAFAAVIELTAGEFSSRVNQTLRVRHTLTYGAHGSYTRSRFAGYYSISLTVPSDEVAHALDIVEEQIRGVVDAPPTPAEVRRVKLLMESHLRAVLDDNSTTASGLAYGWVRGQSPNLFDEQIGKIRALTGDDIHRAAQQWLHPGETPIVVAGDLNQIRPRRNLDHLGPVHIFAFRIEED